MYLMFQDDLSDFQFFPILWQIRYYFCWTAEFASSEK